MAKHIIKHDRDTTLNIKGNNQYWELAKKAEITVLPLDSSNFAGIYEGATSKNNVIKVNGDITMLYGDYGTYGIFSKGMNTTVKIGASSEITATVGIGMESDNSKAFVFNAGWINATEWGINFRSPDGGKVVNNGTIVSQDIGIRADALDAVVVNRHHVIADNIGVSLGREGMSFTNSKNGLVSGDYGVSVDIFVDFTSDVAMNINNAGVIYGSTYGIYSFNGIPLHITNTGTISGKVLLGGHGDDIFDSRSGKLSEKFSAQAAMTHSSSTANLNSISMKYSMAATTPSKLPAPIHLAKISKTSLCSAKASLSAMAMSSTMY